MIALATGLLVVGTLFFIVYRLATRLAAVQARFDALQDHFEKAATGLNELQAKLGGQHDAVVSEKDRMLTAVDAESKQLKEGIQLYREQISNIDRNLKSISEDAVNEVRVMASFIRPVIAMFKTPQTAGIQYAEMELELLLKTHLGESLYERKPPALAAGNEVVDFVIKLPDCMIPIDSKFPEAVYRHWVDAKDEQEGKVRWRAFRDAVIHQMEATAKYIRPEAKTTDYALLFVPSDVIWQQAFLVSKWYGDDNPLPKKSQELRVFGCSTQTLMPYVGLLRLGLRNLRVSEDVKAVQRQIDQISTVFKRFAGDWGVLKRHIGNANQALLDAEGPKGTFSALQRGVDQLGAHQLGEEASGKLSVPPEAVPIGTVKIT
jgi:DNA anti-recombination protein RmuC